MKVPLVALAALALALPHAARAGELVHARRALDAWQLEEAMGIAAPTLRARPDDAEAQLLAAEVLHQRGQHAVAVRLLDAALAGDRLGAEGSARAAALAPRVQASAASGTAAVCRDTAHFRLCVADKDEVVADHAEDVLEAAYAAIGDALQFRPAERGEKIVVEVLPSPQALAGATGLHVREIETSGTIAVCRFHRLMVLSPLSVAHGYGWADTLAHELVHLVVSKKSHNQVPVWLHEGLAKTLESRWRGVRVPQLEPYAAQLLQHAVQGNALVPLARMHPSMAKLASQDEAALAFAEVFSLVGYVRDQHGMGAWVRLLEALGRGASFEAALAKHVAPLPQLEARWRAHLGRSCRDAEGTDLTAPPTLQLRRGDDGAHKSEGPRRPSADTLGDPNVRAIARLGELLAARGHVHAAARNFAAAHAVGAKRYPQLSFRLAEALADDGRPTEARRVLQDAAARGQLGTEADEAQAEAQALFARLLAEGGACREALGYVRGYALRNPFNPELHALAARCYATLGNAPAAARARRHAELSARTRVPARAAAAADQGAAVDVLPAQWHAVRLDDGDWQRAPLWRTPVAPGRHCAFASEDTAPSAPPTQKPRPDAAACADLAPNGRATLRP